MSRLPFIPPIGSGYEIIYRLSVTSTGSIALASTDNGFNLGDKDNEHVAFDDRAIQAKDGTSASALALNKLGGDVNVGPQSGSGSARLWKDGDSFLDGATEGVNVRPISGSTCRVMLQDDAGTTDLGYLEWNGTALRLVSLVHGAPIRIKAEDAGGTEDAIFQADPDGDSTIYAAGDVALVLQGSAGAATGAQFQCPVELEQYSVATAPAAGTNGRVIYVTNGDSGSPCLAVDNGTNWLRLSLGAAIST